MIQDDTIGVATAAWLAGDVGGAHDLVGGALRTSLTETLPGARRRGPLTLPSYQWNQAACLLMQLGNWTRASALIAAQFDLPRVVLEVEPAMPGERVWLEMGPESLKLTIRPESTTRLYWTVCLRLVEMLPLLVQTAKTASQAFECCLSLADVGSESELSFSTADPRGLPIPDPYFISRDAYSVEQAAFRAAPSAWSQRSSLVFWRGATTGERRSDWRSLPRIKLCELAKLDLSGRFDCGVNEVVQAITPSETQEIDAAGLMRSFVPSTAFNTYKYHIDIDGNTNSWPGLFIKLLSGGAVLKVRSAHDYAQWYYSSLKPWIHYIPVESDLSDLMEKVAWLDGHDAEAQAIGEAGRQLASSLTLETEIPAAAARIQEAFRQGLIW